MRVETLVHSEYDIAAAWAACTTEFMLLIVLIRVIEHFIQSRGLLDYKCCRLRCRMQYSGYGAQVHFIAITGSNDPFTFKLWWPAEGRCDSARDGCNYTQ